MSISVVIALALAAAWAWSNRGRVQQLIDLIPKKQQPEHHEEADLLECVLKLRHYASEQTLNVRDPMLAACDQFDSLLAGRLP